MNSFFRRASFVLNIMLALATAMLALKRPALARAPYRSTPLLSETPGPAIAVEEPSTSDYAEAASVPDRRRWLVGQLRTMGVPAKIQARFVLADIEAGWIPRAADLARKCHGDPDTMAALQLEIDRAREAEMQEALGAESFRQWDQENMLREANKGGIRLADSEMDASYAFWKKMQNRELELRGARLNAEIDEAGASIEYERALAEFDSQMRGLLGEERYAQARQLDGASAVADLRQDLARARPNGAQVGQLLQTQKQWNDLRLEIEKEFENDQSSAAYAEQLKELDRARDNEYRRVLGVEAFEALQKERNPGYVMMKRHADIWGLDEHKIDSVYGSIKYYEKAVEDYQTEVYTLESKGRTVDPAEVSRNLQQFAEQTRQMLQSYLGSDNFAQMERNGVFPFDGNRIPRGAPLQPRDRQGGG